MNFLYFCHLVPDKWGAFESLLHALGGACAQRGDRLHLVLPAEPAAPVAERWRANGVTWTVVPGWGDKTRVNAWAIVRPGLRLLRRERPDVAVVHFGNELPSLAMALSGRLAGTRRTRWVWQQDQQIDDPRGLAQHVSRLRLLRLGFAAFVAVYDGGRASMIRRGIPAGRITVIRNAVDDFHGRPSSGAWRVEQGLPADGLLIVTVGSLIARKRIDFALDALAPLLRARQDVHLAIAGGGPERARLETQARELGIARGVTFLGPREDVPELLVNADLYVQTSTAEASSYAILEAMCAGLPAVVTQAGAAGEQIVDGETGVVVERDDAEGFGRAVRALVEDAERRRRFGAATRARWAKRHRLPDAARAYHELYRSLAARGGPFMSNRDCSRHPAVIHVVVSLEPGGLERLVVDWTNARNRAHPDSTRICCLDRAGALAEEVAGDCVTVLGARRARFPWDRAAVHGLRALLAAERPGATILHAHNLAAQQYAVLAVRRTGAPVVHTEHGSNPHTRRWIDRLRLRLLAAASRRLVCVSEQTAREMRPHWRAAADRMRVIPNGIELMPRLTAAERAALRRALGIPPEALVLGSLGRVAAVKGYDRVVRLLPQVIAVAPDVVYLVVGDGPEREALTALAQRCGVGERLRITGFRPDARRCLEVMDLYLAPSRSEGLPLALLEAMAAERLVLVTDSGEQRRVVADGAAGLVLPDDEQAWPAIVADALALWRGGGAAALTRAARRQVEAHYTLAATLEAYEAVYAEVLLDLQGSSC